VLVWRRVALIIFNYQVQHLNKLTETKCSIGWIPTASTYIFFGPPLNRTESCLSSVEWQVYQCINLFNSISNKNTIIDEFSLMKRMSYFFTFRVSFWLIFFFINSHINHAMILFGGSLDGHNNGSYLFCICNKSEVLSRNNEIFVDKFPSQTD